MIYYAQKIQDRGIMNKKIKFTIFVSAGVIGNESLGGSFVKNNKCGSFYKKNQWEGSDKNNR